MSLLIKTVSSACLSSKYKKLADWMHANKLVLNSDKTHLMVMGSRRHVALRSQVKVMAGDFEIRLSESEKLLGGQLQQNLEWNAHIRDNKSSLMSQLSNRINGLRKVSINASFHTKLMIANGVVMSKLTYLITLWGGASQYLIDGLQVQQLAAARIVCGFGSWRWSRRQLLCKVGWLSVKQLVVYHTVLQAHKTIVTGLPRPLFHELSREYPRMTRSESAGLIRQQSGASRKTFKYRATKLYNSVPLDVRTGSVATVKAKLKRWILENVPIV